MRRFWLYLILCPLLVSGNATDWQAKSEEEALFLRRIADFWAEGEYQIAKAQMEEFLAAYPGSSFSDSFCAALGDLYLREKNHSTALRYYARVSDPESRCQIFLNRMQCLYYMEWYATLADECESFLQKDDLKPMQKLHTTYYLAIALYQQCFNAGKEPEALLKLARRAEPHFETLFQSELNNEVAQAFAHLCFILKEYPKAASIYADLAKKNPEWDEEMLFQAALIQAEYDKELAAKTFEEIVKMGKCRAKEAAYNRLVLSFEGGQFEHLVAEKEELLRQIPSSRMAMAHLFLGRSLISLKRYPEACLELQTYISGLSEESPNETLRAALISLLNAAFHSNDLAPLNFGLKKMGQLYPDDAEIPKALFSKAMILKKGHLLEEARQELEELLAAYPQFPQAGQACFEMAHLDYQAKKWRSCRERALSFLSQFPQHDLSPYAWHYLISASTELAAEKQQDKEEEMALKAQLAKDLEWLLSQKTFLSATEQRDWQFLLAKTDVELARHEKAMAVLQTLLEDGNSSPQQANVRLLLALCYRDGLSDPVHFCRLAEEAIERGETLMDLGSLHASLFNAYLERSKSEEPLLIKGADHLFAAFEAKANLQTENILWLADFYYNLLQAQEKEGRVISAPLAHRAASLLEHVLRPIDENAQVFESTHCKLGRIYCLLGKKQEAATLLEELIAQYRAHPTFDWKWEKQGSLFLGEAYAAIGQDGQAIALFESLAKEKSTLRTAIGASACLQGARLRLKTLRREKPPLQESLFVSVLSQLKDLVLQKTLANEPLHLEAALDYIDLQTEFDPNPCEKRIALLTKAKEDFESRDDLLSKDYHEARERIPSQDRIYQAYMHFIEAEILASQKYLTEQLDDQKELQAKSKDLLLQIVEQEVHPALLVRARKRLNDAQPVEQKT